MKLNHLNICTTDVSALAAFFTTHFGFVQTGLLGRGAFALLEGSDGFALNLLRVKTGENADYPENFHVGFLLPTPDEVYGTHAALRAADLELGDVQTLMRGGAATTIFYVRAPGGLLVEVSSTGAPTHVG